MTKSERIKNLDAKIALLQQKITSLQKERWRIEYTKT